MKRFTPFAILLAIAALVVGTVLPGSAASNVAQGFLATSPGPTAALAFSGQLQCEVQVNAPGTLASTPQYSADGVTWVPATVIGNGSITIPGTYIGTNPAAAGYGFLRLNISSFTGAQVSGQLACGDSLPPANSGGTGAVLSVNGGTCVTVSPITGATIVNYSCATPSPSDSGQIHCTISGTTCTATATIGAGENCTATYVSTLTTVPIADLLPALTSVTGTTLTVTGNTSAGSGDTYFNYFCI